LTHRASGPDLAVLVEPLLIVRQVIREQLGILHRRLLAIVRDDDVCRRLMTIPGVGPVVTLTYRVTVDVPARFRNSKAVGAVFGLTPSKYQSGENDRTGAISRCGDEMMRMMLYEAAQSMLLRSTKWSWLKAWAMKVARHRGMKKAIVALARRLADSQEKREPVSDIDTRAVDSLKVLDPEGRLEKRT
jgi:transposase